MWYFDIECNMEPEPPINAENCFDFHLPKNCIGLPTAMVCEWNYRPAQVHNNLVKTEFF